MKQINPPSEVILAWFDDSTTIAPFGSGHINDTFLLETGGQRYLLQRINTHVFKDPHAVMHNFRLVHEHLRTRMNIVQEALTNRHGTDLYEHEGNWWRVLGFIGGGISLDRPENAHQAYQTALGFGQFLGHLADLPADQIRDTIPNFHNLPDRWATFQQAIATTTPSRRHAATDAIRQAIEASDIVHTTRTLYPTLPVRVTHNDTKINNILLRPDTFAPLAVIDWDTIMAGTLLSDFGDLVRTAACTLDENSTDFAQVGIQPDYFDALLRGFLDGCGHILTPTERDHLTFGAHNIIFEQAIRFLTDYLAGNVYYKVRHDTHNLDRALNQLALLASLRHLTT